MIHGNLEPLRAILHRAIAKYLCVTPRGACLHGHVDPVPQFVARILGHGAARTLYRKRRPVCRSLDGVAAVADRGKTCGNCPEHGECTPQVRVDLIVEGRPYRLLLAFTSATNFLAHVERLACRRIPVDSTQHQIDVIPQKGWGELRFREAP